MRKGFLKEAKAMDMRERCSRYTLRPLAALFGLFLISLGFLASCATTPASTGGVTQPTPTSSSSIPTVTITALDYGYLMPETITVQAGLVDVALVNNGTQPHQAQVARLNLGVTRAHVFDELVTKRHLAAAFSLFTFMGGPDTISPGYGQETILSLSAGSYVLLCFVEGPDGIAHIDKGMIHFFTVSPAQGQRTLPKADGEVVMHDFRYRLPEVLTQSRPLTLHVTNRGTEPHELSIVKLATGRGIRDIAAFFQSPSGPPPFEVLGGLAALASGGSGWIKIHLEPGAYAVFSFLVDQRTGQSQLALGMIAQFTVY
jgi:hypothetical protein